MMHSSDEDIELCLFGQFGSIEPNFLQKNTKIIKDSYMFGYGSPWQNRNSSVNLKPFHLSSIVSLYWIDIQI